MDPVYSWRKDPDNPIRIDKNGMMTIVIEELVDEKSATPKTTHAEKVHKDFGTYQQIWVEAMRKLKIKLKPITDARRAQIAARAGITDDMVAGFEDYLNQTEV